MQIQITFETELNPVTVWIGGLDCGDQRSGLCVLRERRLDHLRRKGKKYINIEMDEKKKESTV